MRNLHRRTKVCLLVFLQMTTTLLTGCMWRDARLPVSTDHEAQATISFVAPEYSASTRPYFENVVKEFEVKYPNIKVELQVINWDILDSAYNTMISRNQPPDLLLTNIYAHFAKDGLLNNMDELISPGLKDKFYPYLMDSSKMNGVQYTVPYVTTLRELYYNKDIFNDVGLTEPPTTWTGLEEGARLIKNRKQVDGFGVDLTDNEIWAYLSYFFYGAGGGWMKDGEWTINSRENVEGLTFLKSLYDKGLTDPEPAITTRDEKQRILGNGKLGMLISGNYFEAVVPQEFPGLKWAKGPIPVKEGQTPMVLGVQDVWMSFKTDHTNKDALSKFLDFIYEDARYEEFVLREGFLPTIRTVGDKMAADDTLIKQNLNAIKNAKFYPINHPAWSAVLNATRNMGQTVLLGQMTPKQALDRLQHIALEKSR
ncbi:sugar ABC transporter substrate-binding protein [Paenibacillus chondroitinus]|uniref:Sugar ABC transporter substrate-binding protein n=1 Tax=Paenibacillus chondroitinus TaxID=59842 RepID=A0ABU6D9L5_9BACL|nr:sugar ABC transporter substrate-binding protein [Paenibacillus chondroitinus]MCY9656774.1 sugar ABC transporter substrate-binding protein [Paenibacillus anseongense]MEB4794423.1 sugar ABC transporter substrate-binding protein [Paenibacillus chondroitinus]